MSALELIECLGRTPTDHLHRIAQSAGLAAGENRRALEQELVENLTDRAWLQGILADLGDEEWAALKVIFFNGGDQGITVELCHQIVNLISGKRRKTPSRAMDDLQNRGLVFLRTQNYRQVFFIPTDVLGPLSDIISRQMVFRVGLPPGVPVDVADIRRDLVEDAHRFLAYIYRTEITLTQQGQIFKRHLRALLDLLTDSSEEIETPVGRYPEPLGLLMGYALERRILSRADGLLQATPDLERWVGEEHGAKQADLFAYWQDRYFYQDLQTFLSVMRQVGESWVSVSALVAELEPLINPSQRGSFLLRLRHHLETFLAPLGLVETGQVQLSDDGAGDFACRITAAGLLILDGKRPLVAGTGLVHDRVLLQATFEIIATRPVESRVLWMLELLGDLVGRTDRTLTYRLSRQSVYRALRGGVKGDAMVAFLHDHSSTGVPQNVAFDLKAWAESYGQVYLQEVMLLRCASPILAQQVRASRRTGRFVLGELTATDLIVCGSRYAELLEALEADGLMPRPGIDRPGGHSSREAEKQDA